MIKVKGAEKSESRKGDKNEEKSGEISIQGKVVKNWEGLVLRRLRDTSQLSPIL